MAGYVLISENPSDDEVLLTGDRVTMEWDLFQTGTWFVSYQIAKIEAAFARDGRVELLSYTYDPDAKTLALEMEIKSNNIGQTSMAAIPGMASSLIGVAAVLTIGILAAMVIGAALAFMYERNRRTKLFRKAGPAVKKRLEDPDVSPEEKEVLERGLEAEEVTPSEAVAAASGAVILVVVAVVIFKVLGAFK